MSNNYTYSEVGSAEGAQKQTNVGFTASVLSIATHINSRKFLYFAACIGSLAAFTCGIALGWTSPEIPKLKEDGPPMSIDQESWIGSLLPVGATIGPLFGGIAADKFGRKRTMLLGILPLVTAFAMASVAKTVTLFFILRFLSGLGVGIIFTALPMYMGEIADDDVRGQLGSFLQLFITFGLTFCYSTGPFMSIMNFNIVCLIVPIVFILLFSIFIPESPYYLVQEDKYDDAREALMKLRSTSAKNVQNELDVLKKSVDETKANKASFMDIFRSRSTTKAFIISMSLVFFQQFSGINVIIFYAQDVFAASGSNLSPEISTIITGVVQILSSGATPMLVEKSGKRLLLLISSIGMTLSLSVLAFYFYLLEKKEDVSNISWLPIACLICFIIVYCLGFGPLPWAVMGELFPGNVKSVASTCTASFCWAMGFLITKYFSLLAIQIGKSGSFGIFSLFCLIAANFVIMYVPETTGKSLQEIQELLAK